MTNRLTSIAEASERLGVSTFTTRRLIKAGELRAVRVSKRVMIAESELDRVIANGCGDRTQRERKGNDDAGQSPQLLAQS